MNYKPIYPFLVGIACGFISGHSFFAHSYTAIFFWGLAGIVLGLFYKEKKEVRIAGLLYGFFMMLSFLLFGFQGSSDKLVGFIAFSLLLSVVSSFGGWLAVFIGSKIIMKFRKN